MRAPYCQRDSDDAALAAHGCTLFSTLYLRRFSSGNDEAPVAQGAIDKEVWDLQADSGATKAQFLSRGTTMTEADRAFEHDRMAGRIPPDMRTIHGGNVRDVLIPALDTGKQALVCVNYGVVQDAGLGIGSFRGGHAVVVGNPDKTSVEVADPLRRQTVRWPTAVLVKAMDTFGKKPWGNGRGEFGIVAVTPTFLEVAIVQRDAARAEVKTVRAQCAVLVDQLTERLEACESRPPVPTDPAAIAAARAQGIADAAAAAAAVQ